MKICDVIENCTECPRYGDDCDGSAERLYTHEEAWGMCDLISRADALMELNGACSTWEDDAKVQEIINALPSAEAVSGINYKTKPCENVNCDCVEVVRCKDCKHYIVEGITTQYGWCHEYKHSVNEDDYCSYGERRGGDTE